MKFDAQKSMAVVREMAGKFTKNIQSVNVKPNFEKLATSVETKTTGISKEAAEALKAQIQAVTKDLKNKNFEKVTEKIVHDKYLPKD